MSDSDTEVSYSSEHIHKLLRCAVCLDRYNNPKLLPCQHTFCKSPCLEGLVDILTRTLRCPECRTEHIVPFRGVSTYPNNLTIIGFLSLPRQGITDRQSSNSATIFPGVDGDANNGENCELSRVGNPDLPASRPSPSTQRRPGCTLCRSRNSLSRCSHCDQVICEPCRHSHIDQVNADINRIVNQIRRGMPHVSNTISIIEQKSDQLHQRAETAKSDITETVERYIMELRGRQRLLHSEVEMFLLGELRSLRILQESLELELASMASFCDSTEFVLNRSNHNVPDNDLVDIKRQCVEHMEHVRAYESGSVRMPPERYLQFIIEGNRFSNSIANFGEIIASTSPTPSENRSPRDASPSSLEDNIDTNIAQSIPRSRSEIIRQFEQADDDGTMDQLTVPEVIPVSNMLPREHSATIPASLSWNYIGNYQGGNGERDATQAYTDIPASVPNRTPRRNIQERRRHHYSDTRLPSLIAGGFTLGPSRSLGISPIPNNESSGSVRDSSRPHENDSYTPSPRTTRRSLTGSIVAGAVVAGSQSRPRPSVRFDVTEEETDEPESEEIPVLNNEVSQYGSGESSVVSTAANNYQDKGRTVMLFGQGGSAARQFTCPRGIAVSQRDNTIYVADSNNHRIQAFDHNGRFIKTFGLYGVEEGEFNCLAGVATNNSGQVVICDRYNHRIQLFDHQGNFQSMFGKEGRGDGQLFYPWGLACDNMGFIYVCDKENHRVQVFQSNGTFVRKFGRLGHSRGHLENPHYVAISPDNNKAYVSDSSNHRIQVFSVYGDFLFSFGSAGTKQGQMKYPKGVAVDSQGFVIVADSGNNRIVVFRGDGRFYCSFGSYGSETGQFKGIEGISILANGNVVVSDRENHRIQIF